MTEAHDPLEAELGALRPPEVSPALHEKIAARLAASSPDRSRWLRRITLSGGALVAASLAAVLLARIDWSADEVQVGRQPPRPAPPAAAAQPENALPTFLVYSRALAGSPDELDSLLDQHARLGSQPGSDETRVFAFTRPDDELHPLTGDL